MSQVRLSDLDAAAKDVQMAQQAALVAEALSTPGQAADEAQARLVPIYARKAAESCVQALQRLENMGAHLTGITGQPAPTVPLHLLDTLATRILLAALEVATVAAEAVDRERGNTVNFSETLEGMALGLRTEIFGPVDLRQE